MRLLVALLIIVSAVTADAPELLYTPAPTKTAVDKPQIFPTPSAIALAGLESKIPTEIAARQMEQTFARFKRNYGSIAREAEKREGLQRAIIPAIAVVESSGQRCVKSKKGAVGIMQLMPIHFSTRELPRACDPTLNIHRGARVFGEMIQLADGNKHGGMARFSGSHSPVKRAEKRAKKANTPLYTELPADRQKYIEKVEGLRFAYLFWKLTGKVPTATDFTECRA
jgi:soluble lytic murein transglycosylase-like protein